MKYDWYEMNSVTNLPIIEGDSIQNKEVNFFSGKIMENNYLIASIYYGMNKPIVICNKDLKIINSVGVIPDERHKSQALISYGGHISCFGNKFVFVMEALGYIACYELQNDGKERLLWDHF